MTEHTRLFSSHRLARERNREVWKTPERLSIQGTSGKSTTELSSWPLRCLTLSSRPLCERKVHLWKDLDDPSILALMANWSIARQSHRAEGCSEHADNSCMVNGYISQALSDIGFFLKLARLWAGISVLAPEREAAQRGWVYSTVHRLLKQKRGPSANHRMPWNLKLHPDRQFYSRKAKIAAGYS